MIMPANFTAVNSEVVYGSADLFTILADTTAPIWNAANVKKFNTNLITLVSNSFFADTVKSTQMCIRDRLRPKAGRAAAAQHVQHPLHHAADPRRGRQQQPRRHRQIEIGRASCRERVYGLV